MIRLLKSTFVAIGVLGGCSPLQQAPLVYSSKVIVGVDVSANASESPGAAINIGVKSVDAAYVPIAVSKQLDSGDKRSEAATLEIIRIFAEYGSGGSDTTSKDLTEANKAKIVAYLDAWKTLTEAQSKARAARELYERSQTKITQLKLLDADISTAKQAAVTATAAAAAAAAASAPAPADNSVQDTLSALNKRLSMLAPAVPALALSGTSINFDQVSNKIQSLIHDLESNLSQQKKNAETTQQNVVTTTQLADDRFVAAAQAASLVNTKKTDALSVYGRFDSNGAAAANAAASGATGSVLVGKVFSTGLASQNLTEAVKIEARSKCITSALQLASSLSDDAAKKAFVSKIDQMCLAKQGDNFER